MGWVVPIIAIAGLLLVQLTIDKIMGDGFYTANSWPKSLALGFVVICVGLLGYYLNIVKRPRITNPDTGVEEREASHTLFFIPVQYWSAIILAFSIMIFFSNKKDREEYEGYISAPMVGDIYYINRKKMYDEIDDDYPYGALKVASVNANGVEVYISQYSYGDKASVRKEMREGNFSNDDAFTDNPVPMSNSSLKEHLDSAALYKIIR